MTFENSVRLDQPRFSGYSRRSGDDYTGRLTRAKERTIRDDADGKVEYAVFELRYNSDSPRKVGQIIFDPNGEYANANAQDAGGEAPNALKNVWRGSKEGSAEDVITYGILKHDDE